MQHYVIVLDHPRFGELKYCFFSSTRNLEGSVLFGGPVEASRVLNKVLDEGVYKIGLADDTWENVVRWVGENDGGFVFPVDTAYFRGARPRQFEILRGTLIVHRSNANPGA